MLAFIVKEALDNEAHSTAARALLVPNIVGKGASPVILP